MSQAEELLQNKCLKYFLSKEGKQAVFMKWNMKTKRIFFFHNIIEKSGLILGKKNGCLAGIFECSCLSVKAVVWRKKGKPWGCLEPVGKKSNPSEGEFQPCGAEISLALTDGQKDLGKKPKEFWILRAQAEMSKSQLMGRSEVGELKLPRQRPQ